MTGEYRTGARILAALQDAPMNSEALKQELDINQRQLGLAISYLVKDGRVEQDDRGCYYLVKADFVPPPVVSRGEPPVAPTAEQLATLRVLARCWSWSRDSRITADDVRLASTLIGSRGLPESARPRMQLTPRYAVMIDGRLRLELGVFRKKDAARAAAQTARKPQSATVRHVWIAT
ncbi:MAG: hypothetical protein O9345_16200 [Burkholderiaceae bacterium]|nr:hypothetical protein [Burkholderiales bacterium]MCZ8339668.1 hypothetical protein [Burkholderiaceae bacterium]